MTGDGADNEAALTTDNAGRRVWRFVVMVVVTASFTLISLGYGTALNLPRSVPGMAVVVLGMWVAAVGWWIAVVVHEAGHAFAAWLVGWRTLTFVALPVGVRPRPFSLAWMSRAKVHDAGGWVVPIPKSRAAMTGWRYIVIHAGGPVASLLLAAVALGLGIAWSAQTPEQAMLQRMPTLGVILGALGYQSLIAALLTLLPSTRSGGKTDGDKVRTEWREARDPGLLALGLVGAFSEHEGRLRDTPVWLIDLARTAQPPIEGLDRALDSLTIARALDQRDVDVVGTRAKLDAFLAAYGDSEWRATCDAWLAAVHENGPERARAVSWTGPQSEAGDVVALKLAVAAALAARAGDVAAADTLIAAMYADRRRTRPLERRYFRDVVFDDIAARIRALSASPA